MAKYVFPQLPQELKNFINTRLAAFNDRPPQTVHVNVGNVGSSPSLATPGSIDPEAAAFFGQVNIGRKIEIKEIHMHIMQDGSSGSVTLEVYRERDGNFTLLGSMTQNSGAGNFNTVSLVPSDKVLEAGDYLFVQPTAGNLFSNGADGLTVDFHFERFLDV